MYPLAGILCAPANPEETTFGSVRQRLGHTVSLAFAPTQGKVWHGRVFAYFFVRTREASIKPK